METDYQLLHDANDLLKSDHRLSLSDVAKSHAKMMDLAVRDAGRWSYGVKAIEVWHYTPTGRLQLVEGGSWVDPIYFQNNDPQICQALEKLYNPASPDYIGLSEVAPGEGLCGELWATCFGSIIASPILNFTSDNMDRKSSRSLIKWRNIEGIANDPYQPYNTHSKVVVDAGFYYAAGIPFDVRGTKGVVVFMTRKSVNEEKLQSLLNEEYMLSVTEHIGSVLALREPRRLSVEKRKKEIQNAFNKARILIKFTSLMLKKGPQSEEDYVIRNPPPREKRILNRSHSSFNEKVTEHLNSQIEYVKLFWKKWYRKMCGAGIRPPPGLPIQLTLFAIITAFVAYFTLAVISTKIKMSLGNDLGFELTNLGSMTPLVYTLTAAPSAQPRSIILGTLICMFTGMSFNLIPGGTPSNSWTGDEFDSPFGWFRVAAAVSVASGLMASMGAAHPPAGALVVTFLDYKLTDIRSYQKVGVVVLQDLIFIFLAAILNNTNPVKSYPTYWGYLPNMLSTLIRALTAKDNYISKSNGGYGQLENLTKFESDEIIASYDNDGIDPDFFDRK